MPKWNLEKASELPHSPAKKRILQELHASRGSPVTGSFKYWEQIVRSKNINFREEPEKYLVGKGEQGVLSTHPYTGEITPYWRFKNEESAFLSADMIYFIFETYLIQNEFVGCDIALKFLQMGFTRARRYANHPSGKKYDKKGNILPQASNALESEKARAADVFKLYWDHAKSDRRYLSLRQAFLLKGAVNDSK